MKKYSPKIKYLPLGIDAEMILGLSGILENKINQYMNEFPRMVVRKPASINNGAITFKIFDVKRRNKNEDF